MVYLLWVHWHGTSNTICLHEYFSIWVHSEPPHDCSIYFNDIHQDAAHDKAWSPFLLRFSRFWFIFPSQIIFWHFFSYVFWPGLVNYRNVFGMDLSICFWIVLLCKQCWPWSSLAILWLLYNITKACFTSLAVEFWLALRQLVLLAACLVSCNQDPLNSLHLLPYSFISLLTHKCPLELYEASQAVTT